MSAPENLIPEDSSMDARSKLAPQLFAEAVASPSLLSPIKNSIVDPISARPTTRLSPLLPETTLSSPPIDVTESGGVRLVSTSNEKGSVSSDALPATSVCFALTFLLTPSPMALRFACVSSQVKLPSPEAVVSPSLVLPLSKNSTVAPASATPTIRLSPLLPETTLSFPPIDVIEIGGVRVVSTANWNGFVLSVLPAASVCFATMK